MQYPSSSSACSRCRPWVTGGNSRSLTSVFA
nr:MAG TPA: hypothetical protein [Caudoviricetes sp.]DAW70984.1 MAG TPA: hypothetical protein [Caudoviricetes sp.]